MQIVDNPFAPGAGNQPPELAGRSAILERAEVVLRRLAAGRHDKSQLLLGLRGVGKTVLLNKIEYLAEEIGAQTVLIEAPEGRKLAEQLVPELRKLLLRLNRYEAAKDYARRGLVALRNFASVFKVAMGEVEFSVNPEPGLADSGELSVDLPDLFVTVGQAASAAAGEAKSYAERLFDYIEVGALKGEDARNALSEPVRKAGARFAAEALDEIVSLTQGYPYFLQEWGYHAWNVAPGPLITKEVAQEATERAIARLDEGFFRVRFDRLTPRERDYMRAMAELGPGPHRSGDIARCLGNEVSKVAPLRGTLIGKGMIYSPAHGDTAFTVPMFDEFLKRTIPERPPVKRRRASR